MPRLQQLLSTSLTQSLGLGEVLALREREAQQLGDVERLRGILEAEKIKSASRQKRGMAETLGTLGGAAAGFAIGGPAGAQLGSQLGGAIGGEVSGQAADPRASATSRAIQSGIGTAVGISNLAGKRALARRKEAVDIAKTGKFDPETIKIFQDTGDISVLKGLDGGKEKLPPKQRNIAKQSKKALEIATKELSPLFKQGAGLTSKLAQSEFAGRFAGDKAKKVRSSVSNALDGIIRFRTGAVVNAEEMKLYMNTFGPQAGDSPSVVKFKMNQLNSMIKIMNGEEVTEDEDIFGQEGLQKVQDIRQEIDQQQPVLRFDSQGRRIQ